MKTGERETPKVLARRPRWINQIARDAALPSRSVRFGAGLVSFVNEKSGLAWPGYPLLADACGMSVRHVQRSWQPLVARGHLEVSSGSGRRVTNLYRIVLAGEAPHRDDGLVVVSRVQSRHDGLETSTRPAPKDRQGWRTNLIEPYQKPGAAGAAVVNAEPAAPVHWWDDDPAWTKVAAALDRLGTCFLAMCTLESDAALVAPFPHVLERLMMRRSKMEAALGQPIRLTCAVADDNAA